MVDGLDGRVAAVRRFNRFYTQRIGVLQEAWQRSAYSLTEARVLYELAHRDGATAAALAADLGLDPGYLSRILRRFEEHGLIARTASPTDGRQSLLAITPAGRATFAEVDRGTREEVVAMLERLPAPAQERVVTAMATIERQLAAAGDEPILLRQHRPGDIGWIVARHGSLYTEEFGFDASFEGFVAGIAADLLRKFDPTRDRFWIAERDGELLGSVCVIADSKRVARLRLFLVEPAARGLGLGRRLVDECLGFARQTGYRRMVLSTYSLLASARRIYQAAGFRLIEEAPDDRFRPGLIQQQWELSL